MRMRTPPQTNMPLLGAHTDLRSGVIQIYCNPISSAWVPQNFCRRIQSRNHQIKASISIQIGGNSSTMHRCKHLADLSQARMLAFADLDNDGSQSQGEACLRPLVTSSNSGLYSDTQETFHLAAWNK